MNNKLFKSIAKKYKTTPEEVRREIQASIDEAWETDDPVAIVYQTLLFPNGKPTPEEFLLTLGRRIL